MALEKILSRLDRLLRGRDPAAALVQGFGQYAAGHPSDQSAIDLVPGWNCSFPPELGLTAGKLGLFADPRIFWALERSGPITGKLVLEAGPLEAMHTYMLDQRRPLRIDAIEANRLCFLRCLISAQILQITKARFHLGDVIPWLANCREKYHLVVASGVLYHMTNPSEFLRLASSCTDQLFLWTHYYSDDAMRPDDPRRLPFSGVVSVVETSGVAVRCYERSYRNTERNTSFCGGPKDKHYWLHRDDLLSLLAALGFTSIEVGHEDPGHPGGPCFSVMARRLPAGP